MACALTNTARQLAFNRSSYTVITPHCTVQRCAKAGEKKSWLLVVTWVMMRSGPLSAHLNALLEKLSAPGWLTSSCIKGAFLCCDSILQPLDIIHAFMLLLHENFQSRLSFRHLNSQILQLSLVLFIDCTLLCAWLHGLVTAAN